MDDQKRKERYEARMKRKALPEGQQKAILKVRKHQLRFRRALRNTTPEEWQRKLKISKFILETVPNKNTVYH